MTAAMTAIMYTQAGSQKGDTESSPNIVWAPPTAGPSQQSCSFCPRLACSLMLSFSHSTVNNANALWVLSSVVLPNAKDKRLSSFYEGYLVFSGWWGKCP